MLAITKKTAILTVAMIAAGLGLAMSLGSAQGIPDFAAIIAAPDRAAADRDTDKRRARQWYRRFGALLRNARR